MSDPINPDRLAEALERVFGIWSMGGFTGAMYPSQEGEEIHGYAIDKRDWPIIEAAARAVMEAPTAEWCSEHNDVKWKDSPTCHVSGTQNFPNDCKIGRVRLVAEDA